MSKTLESSPNALINKKILDRYLTLELPENKIIATYIWTHKWIRCKDRTLEFVPKAVTDVPIWSYSTYLPDGITTFDSILKPVAIYRNPFRRGKHILVLCEAYSDDETPLEYNHRKECAEVAAKCAAEEPWFGFEQEYTFLDFDGQPLGWPKNGFPGPQGPYYCGVGADKVFGRDVVEAHYRACLYAGVNIYGTIAESMPSQWEYQVGPCAGVSAADDLLISRFLLHRISEDFGIVVTLDPKPITGNWNGNGAHCNVSTKATRGKNGITAINEAIDKLSKCHLDHIKEYDPNGGKDNERRLTGTHATCPFHHFRAAVGCRKSSIRIPKAVSDAGCGYFEDRRPSSNCDPYSVVSRILKTIILEK